MYNDGGSSPKRPQARNLILSIALMEDIPQSLDPHLFPKTSYLRTEILSIALTFTLALAQSLTWTLTLPLSMM